MSATFHGEVVLQEPKTQERSTMETATDLFSYAAASGAKTAVDTGKPIFDTQPAEDALWMRKLIGGYADRMLRKVPHMTREGAERLAKEMLDAIEAKDVASLRNMMNRINPNWNWLFTQATGLPSKTQREADASIRSLDPEGWKAFLEAKAKRRAERAQRKEDELMSERISHNGTLMTVKELLDGVIQGGFTHIYEKRQGATVRRWLTNPSKPNIGYRVKAKYMDYARKAIAMANAA